MIKVNLLKDQAAGSYRTFTAPSVSKTGLLYAAILLLTTGTMGAWSCHIHRQVTAAVQKKSKLQIKNSHLHKLKMEIDKYLRRDQLLQSRIECVKQLKENRTVPVLLLNTVLHSIPQNGNLWLITLTQTSDSIKMTGFAWPTEVIPDFLSNLMASGVFAAVNLEEIESRKEDSKFSLLCKSIQKTPGD